MTEIDIMMRIPFEARKYVRMFLGNLQDVRIEHDANPAWAHIESVILDALTGLLRLYIKTEEIRDVLNVLTRR